MTNHIRSFLHYTPQLGQRVFIDPSAVVTGQVILGDDVSIWPCVSIRGDLLPIRIGNGTNIQDGSVLHTTQPSRFDPTGFALTIGNFVTVGHKVMLHGCTIHDNSLIGMGAIILDGAVIQSNVFVAAGSLVAPGKVLESGFLYRGNPARQARPLTPEELEFLHFSPRGYIKLKDLHVKQLKP